MKVVCIISMVHSGSTLLDLVLGGHPGFVGLGELSAFTNPGFGHRNRVEKLHCSCGATLQQCEFWGPFSADSRAWSSPTAHERYRLLLRSFEDRFGENRVLVDSSKTLESLQTWIGIVGEREIRVLHLIRDVRSWTVSMTDLSERIGERGVGNLVGKFGWRAPVEFARRTGLNRFRQWYLENRRLERFLAGRELATFQLGYEELALYPARLIDKLGGFLGVEQVETMLSPRESGSHVVLGNQMKGQERKRQGFVYDNRWFRRRDWLLASLLFRRIMKYNSRQVYRNTADDFWDD